MNNNRTGLTLQNKTERKRKAKRKLKNTEVGHVLANQPIADHIS